MMVRRFRRDLATTVPVTTSVNRRDRELNNYKGELLNPLDYFNYHYILRGACPGRKRDMQQSTAQPDDTERAFPRKRARDKRIFHILLQCLFIAGVSRLVHAQDLTDPTIDPEILENSTLTPTVVDPESDSPTAAPSESGSPTDTASDSPSNLPSFSPTYFPTATVSPSAKPTDSFRPSHSPSVSPRPSSSSEPSSKPSQSPSRRPSISPSDYPSSLPSESPTAAPTVSPMPSSSPSDSPSFAPSVSMQPSTRPSVSNAPSVSPAPSLTPSVSPTPPPSIMPTGPTSLHSDIPSAPPISMSPTITPRPTTQVSTVIKNYIYMNLEGMPRNFTQDDKTKWTVLTGEFMWEFFQEIDIRAPGVLPVNVTYIHNPIVRTYNFTQSPEGVGTVSIEYLQAIDYSILQEGEGFNEAVWRDDMFLFPFQYDSQTYILDLINALKLESWITVAYLGFEFSSIPTEAPSQALVTENPDTRISQSALRALSASIVLSAILVVAFLFWDRHRKEKLYMETHAHDFETMEYDNAGQAMDWRNPYSPTVTRDESRASNDGSAIPPDRGGLTAQVTRSTSPQTTASTVIAATPPGSATTRPSGGSRSLPPLAPKDGSQQSMSGGIDRHRITTTPPPLPIDHARHISGADTEITDITYSDGGGGGRSDNGSDGLGGPNLPVLPTITDERLDRDYSWSRLKITEEETYSDSGSQDGLTTGDLETYDNMGMTGFQMTVEELE